MSSVRAHVLITGRVQGVFFRASTEDEATRLGLKGWVRNVPGGGVEAVFEGEEESVQEMIAWCHEGPSYAHVTKVDVNYETYAAEFDSFEVRFF